jgi:hypothetical protein
MEVSSATKEYATRISNENKPGHTGAMQLKWLTILCVLFSYGTVPFNNNAWERMLSISRSAVPSHPKPFCFVFRRPFRLNNLALVSRFQTIPCSFSKLDRGRTEERLRWASVPTAATEVGRSILTGARWREILIRVGLVGAARARVSPVNVPFTHRITRVSEFGMKG